MSVTSKADRLIFGIAPGRNVKDIYYWELKTLRGVVIASSRDYYTTQNKAIKNAAAVFGFGLLDERHVRVVASKEIREKFFKECHRLYGKA